jgi:tRNA uridine 5-carboxymethylaminomethyl modification enzyme
MFSGVVTGVGARYCPSIEDKIVRFANKERHQIFLEPETKEFNTIYVQGLSSSLPRNVQEQMVKTIPGLENAKILKYAYAIEYDAINPLQMKASLESMKIENLFTAGQINGTSGYEEAAGQGLLAGINAARKIQNKEPLILRRDEAYLGVMIDDLVTKGTLEPYRLLTSRSEYRLLCRHDNAYRRLSQKGYEIGLLPQEKYDSIKSMLDDVDQLIEYTKTVNLNKESPLYNYLESLGYENNDGALLFEVIKRPHVKLDKILELLEITKTEEVIHQAEIEIKYEGYINKAQKDADKLKLMENVRIPETFNYDTVLHLANEARQKLEKVRPMSLGQAARISGVNPADIGVLAMALKRG